MNAHFQKSDHPVRLSFVRRDTVEFSLLKPSQNHASCVSFSLFSFFQYHRVIYEAPTSFLIELHMWFLQTSEPGMFNNFHIPTLYLIALGVAASWLTVSGVVLIYFCRFFRRIHYQFFTIPSESFSVGYGLVIWKCSITLLPSLSSSAKITIK